MCIAAEWAQRESRRLDWLSQIRPPTAQSGVSKLHTAMVVQHEVWTCGMHGHTKRTRERPRINGLLSDHKIRSSKIDPGSAQVYVTRLLRHMELHNLPVETTVGQINCRAGNYTDKSHQTYTSGVTGCPLLYNYNKYGCLATDTWTKTLW